MLERARFRLLPGASVRLRLTLWYTLVLTATLVALGAALYFLLARTLAFEQDQDVATTSLLVARAISTRPDDLAGREQVQLPEMSVVGDADTFVQVTDLRTGEPLARSANMGERVLPLPSGPFPTATQSGGAYQTISEAGGRLRIYSRPVFVDGQPVVVVQAAHTLVADDRLLTRLRLLLAVVGGLGLPTTAFIGWVLAGRALAPIGEMTRAAEDLGRARDFSQRLAYRGPADELEHLARTINVMLAELEAAHAEVAAANARLEQSLASQKRFVADASHELRTPLTVIRANADVLRWTAGSDPGEQARAVADIAGEAERMSRLIEALLTLARADAGQRLDLQPVELAPILADAARHAQLLADGQQVHLTAAEDVRVAGNLDALRQLLLILVDNALKYTPSGGHVRLSLTRVGAHAHLTVADTGVGIRPRDLEQIFEPFYRADATRETEGSGLGLAIARWIAVQHAGRIDVSSRPNAGSTFTVVLPALAGASGVPHPAGAVAVLDQVD